MFFLIGIMYISMNGLGCWVCERAGEISGTSDVLSLTCCCQDISAPSAASASPHLVLPAAVSSPGFGHFTAVLLLSDPVLQTHPPKAIPASLTLREPTMGTAEMCCPAHRDPGCRSLLGVLAVSMFSRHVWLLINCQFTALGSNLLLGTYQ